MPWKVGNCEMPLDFSKLNALNSHENGPRTQPVESAQEIPKDPITRELEALRRANREAKKELKEGLEKYRERGRRAHPLEVELLNSAERGEDIHVLFFIAVKALEAYTDSPIFYMGLPRLMTKYYQTAPIPISEDKALETGESTLLDPNGSS